MKKILSIILVLVCLLSLCACTQEQDLSSATKLVYGEKYISLTDYDPEQSYSYIIFDETYMKHSYFNKGKADYTVTYKYEIMNDGKLAYFYDSLTIHAYGASTNTNLLKGGGGVFDFSENIISNPLSDIYVRESYINENLPYFAK